MMTAAAGAERYIYACCQGKLSVIDASDVTSPTVVQTITNSHFNANNPMAIDYNNSILWVGAMGGSNFKGWNISNPTGLSTTENVSVSIGEDTYGVTIDGDYAYVGTVDGLQVWDISNGTSTTSSNKEVEINHGWYWHHTPTVATGVTYNDAFGSNQRYLFTSNKFDGAQTYINNYNITTPTSTFHSNKRSNYYEGGTAGRQKRAGWAKNVQVIATATYQRDAVNWYDYSNPTQLGSAEYIMSNASTNEVIDPQMLSNGSYTYFVSDKDSRGTLTTVNSTNVQSGTTPTIVSTIQPISTSTSFQSCMLNSTEEYLCIADYGTHRCLIYDVTSPSSPSLSGNVASSITLLRTSNMIWYEPN